MLFSKKNEGFIQLNAKIHHGGRVEAVSIAGNAWDDLGYWIEVTSFIAAHAMREKGMKRDEVVEYCADYIRKAIDDYNLSQAQSGVES